MHRVYFFNGMHVRRIIYGCGFENGNLLANNTIPLLRMAVGVKRAARHTPMCTFAVSALQSAFCMIN